MDIKPLSDPRTRASAVILAQQAPIKMPYVAKNGWGVIALLIVFGFIPGQIAGFAVSKFILALVRDLTGVQFRPPLVLIVGLGFSFVFLPSIWLVFYITGRYTCRLTHYYASIGRLQDAETVALGFQATVWYLHVRQNREFASFLRTAELGNKSARYQRFLARLKD
jgi:hypothetical protein